MPWGERSEPLSAEELAEAYAEYLDHATYEELAAWYRCSKNTLRRAFRKMGLRGGRGRRIPLVGDGVPEFDFDGPYGLLVRFMIERRR